MRKKLLSLLVLLMVAVTGAWAEGIVCSASDLGKVLCTDGSIYATLSDATAASKTAAAIIAYVDETNKKGLALALTDEASEMDWATAMSASGAAAHTPVVDGQTWKLPSQEEWTLVKNANSGTSLNSAITNAGGTAIPTVHFDHETQTMTGQYWLSTQGAIDESARTWGINGYDEIAVGSQSLKTDNLLVRACLEFTIEEAAPEPQPAGYAVSLKAETADEGNWTAKAGEGEYQSLPLEGVAQGTQVTLKYSGLKKVKSVKAVKKAPAASSYDNTLDINTYDPKLNNGEKVTVPTGKHWLITGTGEATKNNIIIANNATVTLSGVNITASARSIICKGNATIILADGTTNNLYSDLGDGLAGIEMRGGSGTSLIIQGNTGVLNITSGEGPAIGAGYGHAGCAINIEGGIINATSTDGPGIGAAYNTACGNITISGGTVAATGGYGCPGIGGAGSANCGDITITNGVTSVTATKGDEAPYSIGASSSGSCGTVTIGGVVGAITESPFTYPAPAEPTLADVFTDGAVVGVAVKNTYDTYTVTGTYSGGSYTSITKSSNDIQEVTMTKDGNNLVVWIKGDTNSECTLTFNTQDNTYTKSLKAGTGAAVWDLSEFVSITVNGTDITSSLEDVTPAAPAAKAAAEATAEDKGKLIGTDGNIYADVAAATAAGTTAVAKIIYIGTTGHATYTHGLALALTDEDGKKAWQAAIDACSAKNESTPVTGATWLLASQDQWDYMLGDSGAGSHYDLRDGFSSVGGSNMQWNYYYSSTEDDSDSSYAWYYSFAYGTWLRVKKGSNNYVRACLAF